MPSEMPISYFGNAEVLGKHGLTLNEDVMCPLCELPPQHFATDYQGFRLCRCPKCRLEFVSPRADAAQLLKFVYSDSYVPSLAGLADITQEQRIYFDAQLKTLKGFVGKCVSILDVGCGNGAFLYYARSRGWRVAGIDIKLYPDVTKLDCPFWQGSLTEIDAAVNRFEVIRLNHVLEHTQHPLEVIRQCRSLLTQNGVLLIAVPNIKGLSPRIKNFLSRFHLKRHRWRHYAAMHHLYFFSPWTLQTLLERAGFRILWMHTPVPKRPGRSPFLNWFYRAILEPTNTGSNLEIYCSPDQTP